MLILKIFKLEARVGPEIDAVMFQTFIRWRHAK